MPLHPSSQNPSLDCFPADLLPPGLLASSPGSLEPSAFPGFPQVSLKFLHQNLLLCSKTLSVHLLLPLPHFEQV